MLRRRDQEPEPPAGEVGSLAQLESSKRKVSSVDSKSISDVDSAAALRPSIQQSERGIYSIVFSQNTHHFKIAYELIFEARF